MTVSHMHAILEEVTAREIGVTDSFYVGAGNQIWVLWESSQSSYCRGMDLSSSETDISFEGCVCDMDKALVTSPRLSNCHTLVFQRL